MCLLLDLTLVVVAVVCRDHLQRVKLPGRQVVQLLRDPVGCLCAAPHLDEVVASAAAAYTPLQNAEALDRAGASAALFGGQDRPAARPTSEVGVL